jgi:hypothetical protein
MFPVHAKCVTFDAGYQQEQARARECLELGKVYTIRHMVVGQSSSHLSFYDIPGQWSTVFFDAFTWGCGLEEEEEYERTGEWMDDEPLGGNNEETQ